MFQQTVKIDMNIILKEQNIDQNEEEFNTFLIKEEEENFNPDVINPLSHSLLEKFRSNVYDETSFKKILANVEFTELLRLAVIPELAPFILKHFYIHGVPLRKEYSLFPHQIEALSWMRARETNEGYGILGGIICMKMGMGKTLTALTHILSAPKGAFPTLIVVSKTVMIEWLNQGCDKFFLEDKTIAPKILFLHKDYIGEKNLEKMARQDIIQYDIVITTYDLLISVNRQHCYFHDISEFKDVHCMMKNKATVIHQQNIINADKPDLTGPNVIYGTPWHRVICDESQRFANSSNVLFKCVMALYGKYKWCLSGTPIRNFDTDIWAQFRFCGYTKISRALDWTRYGRETYTKDKMSNFIYSMSYETANIKLPDLKRHNIKVEMTTNQKLFYELTKVKTKEIYNTMMVGPINFANILVMFTRLRQCAIAPFLMTPISKRTVTSFENTIVDESSPLGEWLFDKSGNAGISSPKIVQTVELLRSIPPGEKVVFFSMFTSYIDLLEEAIKHQLPELQFIKVDGDTSGIDRPILLKEFKENPLKTLLLITYKVGGEGLNLIEANHCILGEPWWTNAVHEQAIARLWRTGQTKEVHVYNVITENSVEDRILEICNEKTLMSNSYLDISSKPITKIHLDKFTMGRLLGLYF